MADLESNSPIIYMKRENPYLLSAKLHCTIEILDLELDTLLKGIIDLTKRHFYFI